MTSPENKLSANLSNKLLFPTPTSAGHTNNDVMSVGGQLGNHCCFCLSILVLTSSQVPLQKHPTKLDFSKMLTKGPRLGWIAIQLELITLSGY